MLKRYFSIVVAFVLIFSLTLPTYALTNRPAIKNFVDECLKIAFEGKPAVPPEYKYIGVYYSDVSVTNYIYENGHETIVRTIDPFVTILYSSTPVISVYSPLYHTTLTRSYSNIPGYINPITYYYGPLNFSSLRDVGKKSVVLDDRYTTDPEHMYATMWDGFFSGNVQYYIADRSTASFYNKNNINLSYDHITNVGSVNTTALQALIDQAKLLNAQDYSAESWANFSSILSSAEKQLEVGVHGQTLIDKLTADLRSAMDALVAAPPPVIEKQITKLNIGSYEAVIDQENKTITYNVPFGALSSNSLIGNISALEADSDTITFLVGGKEYPFKQGAKVGISSGDKVYVDDSAVYTIVINVEEPTDTKINALSIGTYDGVIDQDNMTITFEVPEEAGNKLTGKITTLEAGSDTILFLVGGKEYALKKGSTAGITSGDKVYVSKSAEYTLVIKPQEAPKNKISALSIGDYDGVINQDRMTISFQVPEDANNKLTGKISNLEADSDTIIFLVGGKEYPLKNGSTAGVSSGDKVYVNNKAIYTLIIDSQEASVNQIKALSIGAYDGVIEQENRTITFDIPESANQTVIGNITNLEADSDTIIFLVSGKEYPRKSGASVGVSAGDQIYVSSDNAYTVVLNII